MITRETLSELLDVLNVQASHLQTLEQRAYIDGMRIMLEMVMTEHYRKPGCIVYMQRQGWGEYECPRMVLYSGAVSSGCGHATSQTGPFYCSADQTVYIDLDFFRDMSSTIGAGGDFAYAYVIAHEVGHHVQYLLGTLSEAHDRMARLPEKEANKISVALELQADFYAGVWAHNDNEMFGSLEDGDIENAIDAAQKIGDDYLQRKAYGREMPDSFNHGRSEQRVRWLKHGLDTGNPRAGDTFSIPYGRL